MMTPTSKNKNLSKKSKNVHIQTLIQSDHDTNSFLMSKDYFKDDKNIGSDLGIQAAYKRSFPK